MAQTRFAACFAHRALAQKLAGPTEAQWRGLSLGSVKGTNHRTGYKHREESKRKTSEANKVFWAAHPDRLAERGAQTRAERHYRWKGGSSTLNKSIRTMTENRCWLDAVKARDTACVRCGSTSELESHYKTGLSDLIAELGIQTRDDARAHAEVLWALDNGETLCKACHYAEHGRTLPCS